MKTERFLRNLTTLLFIFTILGCASMPEVSDIERKPMRAVSVKPHQELRSWKRIRETNLIMQDSDFSCGSAALATLMRYYFDDNKTEYEILNNILKLLTPAEIRVREEKGLTLLDLKLCAERLGYQAVGVQLTLPVLAKLKGPVLIHLIKEEYKHFAVLRGIRDDTIYLADPSRGNVRLRTWRFTEEWTGVALILGKKGFGIPKEHGLSMSHDVPVQDFGIAVIRARNNLK
ncbi:MAG: C39 family peptidase [Desulfatiglandaceae bacterium]